MARAGKRRRAFGQTFTRRQRGRPFVRWPRR